MKKLLLLLLTLGLVCSCSNDEERTVKQRKKSIFVLGNSITHSTQGGEWEGNWGMAATAPHKDFCGILSKDYNLDRKNIAIWENNFKCEESYYKIVTSKHYDYIVIKIGENVGDIINFKAELQKLTDYYKDLGTHLILVTTVWKQYDFDVNGHPFEVPSDRDRIIKEVANEDGFILVDISAMTNFPNFYAWGEYSDSAIASHPNDLGMEYIANKIKQKL